MPTPTIQVGDVELVARKTAKGLTFFMIICSTAGALAGWNAYSKQSTDTALPVAYFEPAAAAQALIISTPAKPLISNTAAKSDRLAPARMVLASLDSTVAAAPVDRTVVS